MAPYVTFDEPLNIPRATVTHIEPTPTGMMRVPLSTLTAYSFLDPGSGKLKRELRASAARSALVTIGSFAQYVFVLDAWADRVNTATLMNRIFRVHDRFSPRIFGIESNAQQSLFVQDVWNESVRRQVALRLSYVDQPTGIDKDFRIKTALDLLITQGRLLLGPNQHELRDELSTYPQCATRDLVDALASAVSLVIPLRMPEHQATREKEALLSYLRQSGADPDYIERVAAGVA